MGKKMTKKSTPSSEESSEITFPIVKESPEFRDQGFLMENCACDNSRIRQLTKDDIFPSQAIFKDFNPQSKADWISDEWVCFPALPFTIGFHYPFPALTTDFFHFTGLSFVQAMPMVWRVLWVLENLIAEGGQEFGLKELAHCYDLRSHGSHCYLLKTKQNMAPLVLKATRNYPGWKSDFFFVKRDSLPNGTTLPTQWVTNAIQLSVIAPATATTALNYAEILKIDPKCRTFGNNIFGEGSSESPHATPAMSTGIQIFLHNRH